MLDYFQLQQAYNGDQQQPIFGVDYQTEEGEGGGTLEGLIKRVGDDENVELENYHQGQEDEEETDSGLSLHAPD
jgi:hypothetical protein